MKPKPEAAAGDEDLMREPIDPNLQYPDKPDHTHDPMPEVLLDSRGAPVDNPVTTDFPPPAILLAAARVEEWMTRNNVVALRGIALLSDIPEPHQSRIAPLPEDEYDGHNTGC